MDEKPSRWNRMMELVERRFGFRTAQRVASGIDPSGAEKLGKTLMEVSIKRDGDVITSQNAPWRVRDETRTRPSGAGDDWHCAQEGRSRPRESRPKQRADVGRRENKDTTWKRQNNQKVERSILQSMFGPSIRTNMVCAHAVGRYISFSGTCWDSLPLWPFGLDQV